MNLKTSVVPIFTYIYTVSSAITLYYVTTMNAA